MTLSLLASGMIYVAMTAADSLPLWAILMALLGAFGPLFRVGSNAMIADLVPPEQRPGAYALLRMSNNLGIAIGPAIGGFAAAASYTLTFLAAAAAYGIFFLLVLLLIRETLPLAETDSTERMRDGGYGPLLRDRQFLAFCGVATLAVFPASMMISHLDNV
jgi:MFS family permease